jgi:phosphoribosylanthranilate isomerase
MIPKIKVCCIADIEEAKLAIECGASALGLVGKMPSGPGVISDEEIQKIAAAVPPPIGTFLLTSETSARKIIEHHQRTQTNTIQIVDELVDGTYADLRQNLPAIKLVQVIHVKNERSIDDALRAAEYVDALLLDSGNPDLKIKELGGTGRVHDWKLSRQIVEQSPIPVFLAGGLTPENVQEAIAQVQPFGLDVCSGVRTSGKLDRKKLTAFFKSCTSTHNS